ncbi:MULTISPECIES: hypothetical protein [Aquificales]|uniref:hypothetical protein n=1 Tax=Aquificales TaxID=32069 RepID=UPI00015F394A|nr:MULTISPECIES: hypothetical protein [Aquificales]EDP73288.1 hypothetical protein HG1285_12127 [Hydrogenivirga sp. 128-5-R1-1]
MIEKQIEEIKSLIEKTVSIPTPPVLGKVEKVYEVAGKSDFLNCLYSADVRLIELTEGGDFKDSELVIPDVPILGIGFGNNRGIFFLPEKGAIVKVSFLYGCLSYPVIDGILPFRKSIPQHGKDNLQINVPKDEIKQVGNNKTENVSNLWSGSYKKVELTAPSGFFLTGDVQITGNLLTTGNITSNGQIADLGGTKGTLSQLRDTYNSHTHPGDSGGTTGTPNQTI